MSISYEEALSTLQSMFGPPWTRETLDAVLRNQKGHMENTVELILGHGDKDPQILVDQLQRGIDPTQQATANDEQLARQLANQSRRSTAPPPAAAAAPAPARKGRGTPTTLPDDFLRIPNATSTTSAQLSEDEKLARMLQDELFSQELAHNPEFAHLSRGGRPRTVGGLPSSASGRTPVSRPPASRNGPDMPNIMEKISELGDNARRRLQLMAAQFNANNNRRASGSAGGPGGSSGAAAERRGLLDDDDDDMELAARKDL